MKILLLLLLPTVAFGRTVPFNKSVDIDRLEKNLRAASFAVVFTQCQGTKCVLQLADSEKKDPSAIIAAEGPPIDRRAQRIALLKELSTLETKDDAGIELTTAELRRWRKIVTTLLLGAP